MRVYNETRILMLSRSANESYARVAVASFIAQLDPTVSELSDIKTAVSEAVTNAVIHGYENTIGIIEITIRIFDTKKVEITISDKGRGIEDISLARQPLYTTGNREERSGMGFTVMESFMDTLKIESGKGEGTTIIMTKQLSSEGVA